MLNLFIGVYLLGVLTFTLLADFGFDAEVLSAAQIRWNMGFAIWQQIGYGSILAWLVLFKTLKSFDRSKVLPVLVFSIICGIWQVICIFTGWDRNHKIPIAVLFTVAISIVGFLVLQENLKEAKWLKKNTP